MKKYYYLLFLGLIFSCDHNTENTVHKLKKITISGRIYNQDTSKKEILFSVYYPGRSSETVRAKIDSLGAFSASFESYTPTDVLVDYKSGFYTLVHPGDTIYMLFDGDKSSTSDLLETIQYSGDAAKVNQQVAGFQQLYYSNMGIHDQDANQNAVRDLSAEGYLRYLDTIKGEARDMLQKFIMEAKPESEATLWATTFIEKDYYFALAAYPNYRRYLHKLTKDEWDVPAGYYDTLLNFFPVNKSMLVCGSALSGIINTFHYDYVRPRIFRDSVYEEVVSKHINNPDLKHIKDSLIFQGILKFAPDSLTGRLVLSEMIHQDFDANEISVFEKNRNSIERPISDPFLIVPIIQRYEEIKERLTNPKLFSDEIFENAASSTIGPLMNEIKTLNNNKVIYINFWATWCAPCLGEFPGTKTMMKQFENENVAFVFICLDSKENLWAKKRHELKIGGQHYFLAEEQSNDMHEVFEFTGVPYHVLIDKNGIIHEKGAHLSGNRAKKEIDKLLDKTGE